MVTEKRDDRLWLVIIAVTCVAVIGAMATLGVSLYDTGQAEARESMRVELFKSGLQLVVIVVVGGGVALLYKSIERGWDERREQAERRRHYVTNLGDAYRGVREARRQLRACGITGASGVLSDRLVTCYDEQMARISAEQLNLEALRIESEHFPLAGSTELTSELRTMEWYLGRLIDEYELNRPLGIIRLEPMPRLREFTCGAGEDCGPIDPRAGTLQDNFVRPHYRAIALVAD